MKGTIAAKAKVGVLWNGMAAGITQLITFTFGVVLARLLLPEHFGLIASITVLVELAHSITSSGIVTALIQKRYVDDEHYATAFTVQFAVAIVIYGGFIALAPQVGFFFHNALVGDVLAVMSFSVLIMPFTSIPMAILRKRIDFRATGITRIGQQFLAGVIAITLAYWGWGVWSLVYGRLIGFGFQAFNLAYMAHWAPRFCFSRKAVKELYGFSIKIIAANALNDLALNVDYFIIGRLLGTVQLGLYYRAYDLMTLPITKISEAINTVVFSAFSAVQDDDLSIKRGLLKALYYLSLITFPIFTGLFWVSPAFVYIIYGEKWLPMLIPLQIFCLAGIPLSLEPIAISVITAKGYIGLEIRRQVIYVILLVVGISIGSHWGLAGVSCAVLIAGITIVILLQQLLTKIIQISLFNIWEVLKPALISCVIMSLTLFLYQQLVKTFIDVYSFAMLGTSIILGFVSYSLSLWTIASSAENPAVKEGYMELISYSQKALHIFR